MPATHLSKGVKKYREFYAMKPGAPVYMTEFGFYSMDKWKAEGHLPKDSGWGEWSELFGFDGGAAHGLGCLGWCEAGFNPVFETKIVKDLGDDTELAQDFAGRIVKFFKGRRSGFMPEYVDHPVKDMRTWEELCLWRMDPKTPSRLAQQAKHIEYAKHGAAEGKLVCAGLVGGYMYLRSLMGPVELMYFVHDQPELIHACMKAWFDLADAYYTQAQKAGVNIEEVFFAEDICYNHGLLISPDMVREFLFPYYRQLMANIRSRQPDKSVPLSFRLDTDGFSDVAIPLYREIGLNFLCPFEVASNCDVVRTAREYPDLLTSGGFDKRILAQGKNAIDREVDRILPVMKARGGYYPTCDHGVPEEVKFEDYLHFRKRLLEFA